MVKAKLLQSDLGDVDVSGDSALLARQRGRDKMGSNAASRTSSIICYNCKKPGHTNSHCTKLHRKWKFTIQGKSGTHGGKRNYAYKDGRCLLIAAFSTGEFGTNDWYIGSGSSSHMSKYVHWLKDVEPINKEILITNKQRLKCTIRKCVHNT
ncbi:hypothetical protein QLX08_004374 [Tetragonisca angustula]|uniref:CCHC-type domain-containing protein n=1 Tax=Tetragonisca angustula TaxID=166442 RepID=A0AAW1A4K9_9HYME